jgi:hypothetical protein
VCVYLHAFAHADVTSHTSHLTPQHLTPLTSHLTPHTSHLTPHTSQPTPHTSHLTRHLLACSYAFMSMVGPAPDSSAAASFPLVSVDDIQGACVALPPCSLCEAQNYERCSCAAAACTYMRDGASHCGAGFPRVAATNVVLQQEGGSVVRGSYRQGMCDTWSALGLDRRFYWIN